MSDPTPVNEARTIERLPVDSSNLKSVGYDETRGILAVEFQSGAIFHYYQVPLQVFEDMGAAESRGRYYAKEIRGRFVGKPMTGKCPACGASGLIGEKCDYCSEGTVREIDRQHAELGD